MFLFGDENKASKIEGFRDFNYMIFKLLLHFLVHVLSFFLSGFPFPLEAFYNYTYLS